MFSIPVDAKFSFLKYLFAGGGFPFERQTNYANYPVADNQCGIGSELGLGGKYTVGRITFFVNPYLRRYPPINFSNSSNNDLEEYGVKFGAGYNF